MWYLADFPNYKGRLRVSSILLIIDMHGLVFALNNVWDSRGSVVCADELWGSRDSMGVWMNCEAQAIGLVCEWIVVRILFYMSFIFVACHD